MPVTVDPRPAAPSNTRGNPRERMQNNRVAHFALAVLAICTAATLMLSGVTHAYAEPDRAAVEANAGARVMPRATTSTGSVVPDSVVTDPGDIDLDADSSNDASIIIAIVAGIIVIGGAALYVVRRRHSENNED